MRQYTHMTKHDIRINLEELQKDWYDRHEVEAMTGLTAGALKKKSKRGYVCAAYGKNQILMFPKDEVAYYLSTKRRREYARELKQTKNG